MRPLLVGGALLAIAGAVPLQGLRAQTIYTDPGRLSGLQMQVEQMQRDALASQQAADAAQMRLETEQRVASLNAQRADRAIAMAPPQDTPQNAAQETAILQSSIDRAQALDAQVGADADRMSQLTAQALARGNARIVAVKPALR